MDPLPQKWARQGPIFSRPVKSKVGEGGIGKRGVVLTSCSVPSWLCSLAPTLWAVEKPDPVQSCRLLEPLPAGAQRAPGQKSAPKVNSSQKRAHPNPVKND